MRLNMAAVAWHVTHEGTSAKQLKAVQELRRTLLSCLLWEDTYYEKGNETAKRLAGLVLAVSPEIAVALAIEAREKQKLRHVPLFVASVLAGGDMEQRRQVAALLERVIQRADELTEFLALYWRNGRCPLSAQVKRGLARAFGKFSAEQLAKYDRDEAIKLRDVLFLTHPKPKDTAQADVWKQLASKTLAAPDTWEVSLSSGADKKATWERLLSEGKLGALALLRNLRNMLVAKVSEAAIREAIRAMSVDRVLPFRFIAAARYAPNLEPELEAAMFRCLDGHESLPGKTALIVDTSPSMWMERISAKSDMDRFEAAAALTILCREICEDVAIYAFNNKSYDIPLRRGFALRDALAQTKERWSCGGLAVAAANEHGYDRLIVLTDGQWHYSLASFAGGDAAVVAPAPLTPLAYMINVGTCKNGVGYGKWTQVDGWSEHVLDFVQGSERMMA